MRILVTNDDGIHSPGLRVLSDALSQVGEVTVVAPDREQSGVGTAITLSQPIRVMDTPHIFPNIKAYAVEGTPADSAILGLETLIEEPVDLVVSGINQGANMGNDIFISGTVGAALQGYFRGIPAIAISVAALKDVHFTAAALVAKHLATGVANGLISAPIFLNVNVPNVPIEKIKGVSLTHLGRRTYMDVVKHGNDGRRDYYWISREKPGWILDRGLDNWVVRRRRISITPITTDLTQDHRSKGLRSLSRTIRQGFRT